MNKTPKIIEYIAHRTWVWTRQRWSKPSTRRHSFYSTPLVISLTVPELPAGGSSRQGLCIWLQQFPYTQWFPQFSQFKINLVLLEMSCNMEKSLQQVCHIEIQRNLTDCWQKNELSHTQSKKPGTSFYDSDKASSSNNDKDLGLNVNLPLPSLPPTKHRCTKSTKPSTSHTSQAPHVSAGQGMSEMAMSLTSMVKAIKKKRVPKMPKVPTPPLSFHRTLSKGQSLSLRQTVPSAIMRWWMWLMYSWLTTTFPGFMPLFRHPKHKQVWCSITWKRCMKDQYNPRDNCRD